MRVLDTSGLGECGKASAQNDISGRQSVTALLFPPPLPADAWTGLSVTASSQSGQPQPLTLLITDMMTFLAPIGRLLVLPLRKSSSKDNSITFNSKVNDLAAMLMSAPYSIVDRGSVSVQRRIEI
jgi:hypothetical protein